MSALLSAMACGTAEKPDLIDELFAEYLDYDRLTADDITALSEGRTQEEQSLIASFHDAVTPDDFIAGDERDTLIKLGASAETLSRHAAITAIGESGQKEAIPQIEAEIARLKALGGEDNLQFHARWETALARLNLNSATAEFRINERHWD